MTKPINVLHDLETVSGTQAIEIIAKLKVDANDAIAARLLVWLEREYPTMTQGELDSVLDAAKFLTTLFGSLTDGGDA